MDSYSDALSQSFEKVSKLVQDHPIVAAAVGLGATTIVAGGVLQFLRSNGMTLNKAERPSAFQLKLGNIDRKENKDKWANFQNSYSEGDTMAGNIDDKEKTVGLVDDFYNFVTDLYEWGWGQSFHFAPKLPGRDWSGSEAAIEARIASYTQLTPDSVCLDAGCGVGGPMRTVAAVSGAKVVGLTINQYQVDRATYHNKKGGFTKCEVIQGDFHNVPYPDGSFDAIYSIEATCHSPDLQKVYGEFYRLLKPGGRFVSQEWVSTPMCDLDNKDHVRILEEINFGNGLPDMRTWKQAEDAGKAVGFDLVISYDMATASPVNGPWFHRLSNFRYIHYIDQYIVTALAFLRIIPRSFYEVHTMLFRVAHSLAQGGETGVFTPMQLLVFEKPKN
eukprot:TRINITY_DN4440_c0_g5_i1.p1 TRINITY_DN4440_c0_g5~~TRINITY_DN4440_c0_g5_i1.p1  ORF type:complete len:388 (-),score=46.26 TRINITY_DN4440_c0_g5_i1:241-1404(-)